MNKKGQLDYQVVSFIVIAVALFLMAPFVLKINRELTTPLQDTLGSQSQQANQSIGAVSSTLTNFWDFVIVFVFFVNIILIFITAFLVDVHPIFLVVFVVLSIFTLMFAPELFDMLDTIYGSSQFTADVANLPMTYYLYNNFALILLSVMILSGVIMYGKYRLTRGEI